jgi:endonuclease/exonuclease/phosphatase family metal-dependent hydrolase
MKQLQGMGVFGLAALLTVLTGCQSGRSTLKKVAFSSTQLNQVKVMTFNIRTRTIIDGLNHWNHRKGFVADTIAGNGADIVGLQEVRNSQLKYIKSKLPQYAVYAAGRCDGEQSGESCPVLYRKDRFELLDSGTFWFSDTPSIAGSKGWGNLPPRICSWVHLAETHTGNGLYVYNLHLDHISQNSREKSVQLLMKKIAARQTNEAYIMMGDFNMEVQNPAMRWLNRIGLARPRLASFDVWQSIHPNRSIGTRHGFNGHFSGPQIDHIRFSSNLLAIDARIDNHSRNGRYPSDHFPVVANIRFNRSRYNRHTAITAQASLESDKQIFLKPGTL